MQIVVVVVLSMQHIKPAGWKACLERADRASAIPRRQIAVGLHARVHVAKETVVVCSRISAGVCLNCERNSGVQWDQQGRCMIRQRMEECVHIAKETVVVCSGISRGDASYGRWV